MKQLLVNGKESGIVFHDGGIYEIDHYDPNGNAFLRPYSDPYLDKILHKS
jgi:hypothetical protein